MCGNTLYRMMGACFLFAVSIAEYNFSISVSVYCCFVLLWSPLVRRKFFFEFFPVGFLKRISRFDGYLDWINRNLGYDWKVITGGLRSSLL